jgi:release factor glutamine methyltransferase
VTASERVWSIRECLEWTEQHFAAKGEANSRLTAQWLLAAATGLSRIELYTHYEQPLSKAELAAVRAGIERRLAGEPLQYISGHAPFRHLDMRVRPGVLIPRPETEVLVDVILAALPLPTGREARILDLCTGSGCIALSLVYECPNCHVTAVDIDSAAVELTQENAHLLELGGEDRLCVLQGDLATELLQSPTQRACFDVVVSNPPYIPTAEYLRLPREVAEYEPRIALDGGEGGLDIFCRIAEQAWLLLVPGGLLGCELHETTLEQAKAQCEQLGFTDVEIHQDLNGKPRIIAARKPIL